MISSNERRRINGIIENIDEACHKPKSVSCLNEDLKMKFSNITYGSRQIHVKLMTNTRYAERLYMGGEGRGLTIRHGRQCSPQSSPIKKILIKFLQSSGDGGFSSSVITREATEKSNKVLIAK